MGFRGEDKLVFYTIMGIYTEVVVCLFLIPIIGILISGIIIGTSIPLTLFALNYYKLTLYKKLREEIGAIPFWSGWIISKNGDWHYVDFGVVEKEEILVSDEDVQEYEAQYEFQETIEKVKSENEELHDIVDIEQFNDEFVDKKLDREYRWIGLSTSRQIYAFEMIRAFYDITDKKMELLVNKLKELIQEEVKLKDPEKIQKAREKLSNFENIVLSLSDVMSSSEYKPSKITEFLERKLIDLGITDKIAYNVEQYRNRTIKLRDVERIGKSRDEITKSIKRNALPLVLSLITLFISIGLVIYVRTIVFPYILNYQVLLVDHEIGMLSLTILAFIPMAFAIISILVRIKKINDEEKTPMAINFTNIFTKRFNFDNYCEMKRRLKQYASDARIYKVFPFQKYRKMWDSDHIIVILPSSYEDSMTYDIGNVSHRGYPVEVLTTPYVMLDIGTMYGDIPIYLMIACSYIFKRFTKIFYNYNLLQNWKNKTYLYLISQIQSKYQILEPEKQTLKIQLNEWQNWAVTQIQIMSLAKEQREQEMIKVERTRQLRRMQGQEEDDDEQPQPPQMMPQKPNKKKNFAIAFLVLVIIILVIILLIPILTNSLTNTPPPTTNSTTNGTTTKALSIFLSFKQLLIG